MEYLFSHNSDLENLLKSIYRLRSLFGTIVVIFALASLAVVSKYWNTDEAFTKVFASVSASIIIFVVTMGPMRFCNRCLRNFSSRSPASFSLTEVSFLERKTGLVLLELGKLVKVTDRGEVVSGPNSGI